MRRGLYKCPFMCLDKDTENETFILNNFIFNNSNEEKILGITIDDKLTFKGQIKNLFRKTQKMWALSRLLNHLSDSQIRLITVLLYGCFVLVHQII